MSFDPRMEILRQHPLLNRLDAEQILRFANSGTLELFGAGEDIVEEGTLGDSLFLLLVGRAEILVGKKAATGGKRVAVLRPGEFFGEMSLVEPAPRSATVRAVDACQTFRLPHVAMQKLLEEDPSVLHIVLISIVRVLSERLRKTNEVIGSVGLLSEFLAGSML